MTAVPSYEQCEKELWQAFQTYGEDLTCERYKELADGGTFPSLQGLTILYGDFQTALQEAVFLANHKDGLKRKKRSGTSAGASTGTPMYDEEFCLNAMTFFKEHHDDSASISDYEKFREKNPELPSMTTIHKNLGSWQKAKERVGMKNFHNGYEIGSFREVMLSALKRAAAVFGNELSKRHYDEWRSSLTDEKVPSSRTIASHFSDWNNAKQEAGLATHPLFDEQFVYTEADCLNSLKEAAKELPNLSMNAYDDWRKKQTTRHPNAHVVAKKMGSWIAAKEKAKA